MNTLEDKVFNAVMLSTTEPINKDRLFIVWSCYILGNRKYLVGCVNSNHYYEVTYNNHKSEWYVDEYIKNNNKCIQAKDLTEYTKINK